MINWVTFENELYNHINDKRSKSEDDTAVFIANLYDRHVKMGENIFRNRIYNSNKLLLKNYIHLALMIGRSGNTSKVVDKISMGILFYWRSVLMDTYMPPPGSVSVVSNIITYVGNSINFRIYNTTDSTSLIKSLTSSLKLHALTISGINTAMTYVGNSLIPITYSWTGIT